MVNSIRVIRGFPCSSAENFTMKRFFLGLGAIVIFLLAGCGRTLPPNRSVYPVRGKVVFGNGQPVRLAIIHLDPKDSTVGNEAEGIIGPDGTFEIRTYSNTEHDGAVPGEYVVSFEPYSGARFAPDAKKKAKPSVIPSKYQDSHKSKIEVVIRAEDNDLGTIKLE
jgi:hypothetical protein